MNVEILRHSSMYPGKTKKVTYEVFPLFPLSSLVVIRMSFLPFFQTLSTANDHFIPSDC